MRAWGNAVAAVLVMAVAAGCMTHRHYVDGKLADETKTFTPFAKMQLTARSDGGLQVQRDTSVQAAKLAKILASVIVAGSMEEITLPSLDSVETSTTTSTTSSTTTAPAEPTGEPVEPADIVVIGKNKVDLKSIPITRTLDSATMDGHKVTFTYAGLDWPDGSPIGGGINARCLIIYDVGGQWVAQHFDWLRPNQKVKTLENVYGEYFAGGPLPVVGQPVYFVLVKSSKPDERTNIVPGGNWQA